MRNYIMRVEHENIHKYVYFSVYVRVLFTRQYHHSNDEHDAELKSRKNMSMTLQKAETHKHKC